jgi:hypothetical protein
LNAYAPTRQQSIRVALSIQIMKAGWFGNRRARDCCTSHTRWPDRCGQRQRVRDFWTNTERGGKDNKGKLGVEKERVLRKKGIILARTISNVRIAELVWLRSQSFDCDPRRRYKQTRYKFIRCLLAGEVAI